VTAVGAEKLDLFSPQFLIMAIKFALALRTGHPKYFRHRSILAISELFVHHEEHEGQEEKR
jgi:hypothetical protein